MKLSNIYNNNRGKIGFTKATGKKKKEKNNNNNE